MLAGFCLSMEAAAEDSISVCLDNQPHPPYYYTDRDGTLLLLQRMAAERAGLKLVFHFAPERRCYEEIGVNSSDAVGAASLNESSLAGGVFPHQGDKVDRKRALATGRAVVFRIKGTKAGWSGGQFHDLHTHILMPPGMAAGRTRLADLGVAIDDGATNIDGMGEKLLAGHGDLAIALEYDVQSLQKRKEFAGKIEILTEPFTETEYYMVFSRQYYAKHPQQAENMWNAIAHVRHSPDYAAALRRAGLPPPDLLHNN